MDRSACRSLADDRSNFFFNFFVRGRQLPEDDEEEDGSSVVIYAETEIGEITDYLKANPYLSREEVIWQMSVPYLEISKQDATRVIYLSEKQAKKYKAMQRTKPSSKNKVYDNADDFAAALGI